MIVLTFISISTKQHMYVAQQVNKWQNGSMIEWEHEQQEPKIRFALKFIVAKESF